MPINQTSEGPRKQYNIRISDETKERLTELARPLGMTGNEFVAAAVERYADILAQVMLSEQEAHHQISEDYRRQLLEGLQSSRR